MSPALGAIDVFPNFINTAPYFDGTSVVIEQDFTLELVRRVGDAWVAEAAPANYPFGAAFTFHEALNTLFAFGGFGTDNTTFSIVAGVVTPLDLAVSPPARGSAFATYDSANERMILYGGFGGGSPLLDTWSFDGTSWTQLDDNGPLASGMFFHAGRSSPMLFTRNALFEFVDNTWVEVPVRDLNRVDSTFVYDASSNTLLAAGGNDTTFFRNRGEVFSWDGVEHPAIAYALDLEQLAVASAADFTALELEVDLTTTGSGGVAPAAFLFDGLRLVPLEVTDENGAVRITQVIDQATLDSLPKRSLDLVLVGRGNQNAAVETLLQLDTLSLTFMYSQPAP